MPAKHAINDKLQGSVATHFRCGGVVHIQIKNGLLLSLWVKKNWNRWMKAKSVVVSCIFAHQANTLLKDEESVRDNHVLACNYAKYSPIFKKITHRLSNKSFFILLLTTRPHLKYVATLPCNLSLIACFADINVSQGSVATYARCGGRCNVRLTTNLLRNLPVKIF